MYIALKYNKIHNNYIKYALGWIKYWLLYNFKKGYCMNIGEYCPSQYIILHSQAREIWYTAWDNIHQYLCNNPIL